MRKILLTLLFLLLLTTQCFAANNSNNITQIISDYKDLNNRFDVGISYLKFKDEFSDIYVKVRRFQEENPTSFPAEINNINDIYSDISALWQEKINNRLIVIPNQTARDLKNKYPGIEKIVSKGLLGGWNPDSTILALNHIAQDKINLLANNVKNLNGPSYGIKYADGLIGGCIFISQVEPRSNAYEAGLRMGDRVTKINDMPVTGVETFTAALAGPEGSRIKLTIKTDNDNEKIIEIIKTVFPH